jgi:hypothetical protein
MRDAPAGVWPADARIMKLWRFHFATPSGAFRNCPGFGVAFRTTSATALRRLPTATVIRPEAAGILEGRARIELTPARAAYG